MDSFTKISNLFKEMTDELANLKKELENDMNYSVSHAEIVTSVELVEDVLHEAEMQIKAIEKDIDYLNQKIEEASDDEDEDAREARFYSLRTDDDE